MPKFPSLLDRISSRLVRHGPFRNIDLPPGHKLVSFTFDDVPETALVNGARILEENGVRGTFYIAGGLTGKMEGGRQSLSFEGQRALNAKGHEIACHTFSHDNIRTLSRTRLAGDLDRNAEHLRSIAPDLVAENFAYPYTIASPLGQIELARRYTTSRGGIPGINQGKTKRDYLKSVEIRAPNDVAALSAWIDQLAASTGWLIYFTHDVGEQVSDLGCRSDVLDHLVKHARNSGCDIVTVKEALHRMGFKAPRR
jgi:peptidoglycan/xylan/chitin deacetylase (PgdA/CDA1 family)